MRPICHRELWGTGGAAPLVVIFALAGGELFRHMGILLAVPVAAVLRAVRFAFTIWLIDTKCIHRTQYNLDGKRRPFCCLRALEIRQMFIDYFVSGHIAYGSQFVTGAADDPTLLFTNAG